MFVYPLFTGRCLFCLSYVKAFINDAFIFLGQNTVAFINKDKILSGHVDLLSWQWS
jgi:hypothetical protein